MTLVLRRQLVLVVLFLAGLLASGCSRNSKLPFQVANLLPEVRVTSAPIDINAVCAPDAARSCYSLTFNWVGYDPDGRVDRFIYAVDPPDNGDTTWITTTDNEKRLVFDAPSLSNRADSLTILRGYHVFVIAAIDNDHKGAEVVNPRRAPLNTGPRVYRAFFSFTKAPTVTIDAPRPVTSAVRTLPPSIRIAWHGRDEDGVFTNKPVRYKYLLLGPGNETSVVPGGISEVFNSKGAAIRQYYAPEFRADQGWTSISGDTTSVQFTNLVPGASYMFAVVAFDEAGAFSPVFGFDTNLVRFQIGYAAAFGPRLTVFNEFFFYQYPGASYNPAAEVYLQVPAGRVTFNWFATPPEGAILRSFRWMLDGDVFDQRPRTDEINDLKHWSSASVNITNATVGPFTGGDHFFYVEAEDNTGLRSLATIHFFVVVPTFAKPLLLVNDTRYRADQFLDNGATLLDPAGLWPASAELDTFMTAVGRVQWRSYAEGTLTTPGILHGYEFDTLGTRKGIPDMSTSLAKLGEYRHVIWLIDFASANASAAGNSPTEPITSLRYMNTQGKLNALGAYVRMGGEAWLVGGGGAFATLISYDDASNNVGGAGTFTFNSTSAKRELAPGRFMYDVAKWQTVIRSKSQIAIANGIQRKLGRFRSNPGIYQGLPETFDARTQASDPLPPRRTIPNFYTTTFSSEYINEANSILETVSGEPNDFKIDGYNDLTPGPVLARWPSSDTLNTVTSVTAVTPLASSKASGHALRIQTQGGGASTGDFVTRDLGTANLRDWTGLYSFKLAIKQDQPTSLVQWRVRAVDAEGNSASALISPAATGRFVDLAIPQAAFSTDLALGLQPNFLRIRKVVFTLDRGDAAGSTEFDNVEVVTLPEGAVLDTLMATRISFSTDPDLAISASMTVYHGHDLAKQFIFTGFAPWAFRRSQCQQLFDFVLQKMWGLPKNTASSFVASRPVGMAPAHVVSGGASGLGRGVRRAAPIRSGPDPSAGVRRSTNPGVRSPRNGNP